MTGGVSAIPRKFAAIDFEFARLKNGGAEVPVQIGIVAQGCGTECSAEIFTSYLRPPGEVCPGPGLRNAAVLRDAPAFLALWPQMHAILRGRVLLAHGAGTEKRFLRAFPGHGFGPWIDTLPMSRAIFPDASSHSLGALCTMLGVNDSLERDFPNLDWHDALYDAAACLRLFFALMQKAGLSPEDDVILRSPDLRTYFRSRRQ